MKKAILGATAAAALLVGGAASATTVTGEFTGSFANVQGADGGAFIEIQDNQITWGSDAGVDGINSIQISSGGFSGSFPPAGSIMFGSFNWENESSFNTGGTWTVDMTLAIDFLTPTDLSVLSETINIQVENTTDPSTNTGTNEVTGLNPDFVSNILLSAGAFNTPLNLGSGLTLTNVFFGMTSCTPNPGTSVDPSCTFDAGTGLWTLREGATSTIAVYGEISVVPLPASALLLLGGIGGLAALRRKKKA